MKRLFLLLTAVLLLNLGIRFPARAQSVAVTLQLDAAVVPVGGSTILRVFAQVVPAERADSERIFSWHIDLLNGSAAIAQADYAALRKLASDNVAQTSSSGVTDGANRRGIHDTFITDVPKTKSGTGVTVRVELFSVPIKAVAAGQAIFRVTAGSNTGLAADFIVAPKNLNDDPRLGGVYDDATVTLTVIDSGVCVPKLSLAVAPLSGGRNKVTLNFVPCAGRTHVVEFRDTLGINSWQPLPSGPHNSGSVTDTNVVSSRFYRVRVSSDVTDPGICTPRMSLAVAPLAGGKNKVTLNFLPCAGRTHVVEFRDTLGINSWQPLPSGPHNSGSVTDTNGVSTRLYRVRVNP